MTHTHEIDENAASRYPECVCGEFYWSGSRWLPVPEPSAYL